eukprot:TRINITY_DN39882_c0_g1_i1.p1 TRINITY_DN39882_c0_g1~~TRINITY_DN39882_c0_g1_i1.p1  ORF type:complete len:612 (+),score=43.18 TRINITY_DN39882_c0_g1_i1:130-1965(+)
MQGPLLYGCFVLSFQNLLADQGCWDGHYTPQFCCDLSLGSKGNSRCFDELFTFERCCVGEFLPAQEAHDTQTTEVQNEREIDKEMQKESELAGSCFGPHTGYSYEACCINGDNCWDAVYTVDRCCGSQVALNMLARSVREDAYTLWSRLLTRVKKRIPEMAPCFWLVLFVPAILFRANGEDMRHISTGQEVPLARELKVWATLGITVYHHLHGSSLATAANFGGLRELPSSASFTLLICCGNTFMDLFFIVTTYLVASRPLPSFSSGQLSMLLEQPALAVLRRFARTTPCFAFATALRLVPTRQHILQEFLLPSARIWPFAHELLCYAAMQLMRSVLALCGFVPCLAVASVILALCHQNRLDRGANFPATHFTWWQAYTSVTMLYLPLCLLTFIVTRVLGASGTWKRSLLPHAAAVLGFLFRGFVEWCWIYGPRSLVPWWSYPFLFRLPFMVGIVWLLEASRGLVHTEKATERSTSPLVSYFYSSVDAYSVNYLLLEVIARYFVADMISAGKGLEGMTEACEDILSFMFALPAHWFWLHVASAALYWGQNPYQRGMLALISYLNSVSCSKPSNTWACFKRYLAKAAIVLAACAYSYYVFVCWRQHRHPLQA